jgi:hypothetical protein
LGNPAPLSTYSAIQTLAALSRLSLQTNFTKLLPLITLRQSTLYNVLALLIAILQFLLDETTEELPIVFQLVLNQKSAWIVPNKLRENCGLPPRAPKRRHNQDDGAPLRATLEKIEVDGGVFP